MLSLPSLSVAYAGVAPVRAPAMPQVQMAARAKGETVKDLEALAEAQQIPMGCLPCRAAPFPCTAV